MNWKHGYYADSGYTYGYYVETTPARMAWAALIQGHQTPLKNFRYLDAGCGQGLSLLMMAASHPDSEFVGIDFLPEHIAHANELARACGVTNVQFIEGDFIELEKDPRSLGQFDYAVCHGISTWISPAVKAGLFSLVGKVLRPGGLFYNSYNTLPGWLTVMPFQHLVLLEQRSKAGGLALKSARESMESLFTNSTALSSTLPGLAGRLKRMESQDPAYLVQEYNNQFWDPVFVTQMMDDMARVKLSYLGTATLPEAFESSYSAGVRSLISGQATPALREQLRDYAINQSFRRDLYVKGLSRPWAVEQQNQLRSFKFASIPGIARPEADKPFVIKAGAIELNGKHEFYKQILDHLDRSASGCTLGELIDVDQTKSPWTSIVQAVSMLLHGGWISLHNSEADASIGKACNIAIARAACAGAPYRYLSAPRSFGAINATDVELFFLNEYFEGRAQDGWVQATMSTLTRLGRSLLKDGQPVSDKAVQLQMVQALLSNFVVSRLAQLKALGAA